MVPNWITQNGIRAGFCMSTSGDLTKIPPVIQTAKDIGLNSLIVYGCSFAETPNHLKYYREWVRLCNAAGIHVFALYAWQPPVGNTCRPVVFADGTEGLFPCPLDDQLWSRYLIDNISHKITPLNIDGIFLDMEMYRTEREPNEKRYYSFDTCFCDSCFSGYFAEKHIPQEVVLRSQRKAWLKDRWLLQSYYTHLSDEVEGRTQTLKNHCELDKSLLFGIYPAIDLNNWVQVAVMRSLGYDAPPVLSFSTDTYGYYKYPWGSNRIPSDLLTYFSQRGINGLYSAGYLLRMYTASDLKTQIIESLKRSNGYWLFNMDQLTRDGVTPLAGGTRSEYLKAIQDANKYA